MIIGGDQRIDGASPTYRPDIDGLRAIAVLSVVLYHVSKDVLPGGYLGVDIFFVLSGFLITTIIWREAVEGHFSIARFYERRIRRIMPALLLVLGTSSMLGVLILLPPDLSRLGASSLASLAFVANVYFWRDTNYFAPGAEQKPLLHIWSLGIEEQFYILFPLLLILCARFWPRWVLPIVALLALGSLGVNMLALAFGAGSPAFFLLPARAWELGAGAVLALASARAAPAGRAAHAVAAIGLSLIALGLFRPAEYLGLVPAAAPAVAGTVLLIWAGMRERRLLGGLLAARPVVFIGLISYSLYLWHWPLLVFAQYVLIRHLTVAESGAAFIVMLSLAWLSWRFVERPFRAGRMTYGRVLMAVGLGTALVGAAAVLFAVTGGLPGRLNREAGVINAAVGTNYRCAVQDYIVFGSSRACLLNLPSRDTRDAEVILLGNSHAQMYAPVWREILEDQGRPGLLVPLNGCLPTVTANIDVACIAAARGNLQTVLGLPQARTIVLGLTWRHGAGALVSPTGAVLDNSGNRVLVAAIEDLVARLNKDGRAVILIGPIAEPGYDVASVVSRKLAFGWRIDDPLSGDRSKFMEAYGPVFSRFENNEHLIFVRPDTVQCIGERCEYILDGHALFADSNHIAQAELYRFKGMFTAALAASDQSLPARSSAP